MVHADERPASKTWVDVLFMARAKMALLFSFTKYNIDVDEGVYRVNASHSCTKPPDLTGHSVLTLMLRRCGS